VDQEPEGQWGHRIFVHNQVPVTLLSREKTSRQIRFGVVLEIFKKEPRGGLVESRIHDFDFFQAKFVWDTHGTRLSVAGYGRLSAAGLFALARDQSVAPCPRHFEAIHCVQSGRRRPHLQHDGKLEQEHNAIRVGITSAASRRRHVKRPI